ncbi:MAG: cell wall metabolism sensor histidine kinase WalK [Alicyclobacillus sp.]|nr:cell wall metabolism sensor histidine kinase WalK [Alicyclobacillus sp.]
MWRSIRTKFVVVYLLLILFSLELIGAYFLRILTASLIHSDTDAVQNQAMLLATLAAPMVEAANSNPGSGSGRSILASFPEFIDGSVYVLNKEGVVLDTSAGIALIGQKRVDSAVTQVMVSHKLTNVIHFDPIDRAHLLTVAVPIAFHNHFTGIVEYVVPIEKTYETIRQVTTIFYTVSAIVLGLTALLGIVLSRTITHPIVEVIRQTKVMAGGDFSRRVRVLGNDEFGDLATAVNDLTARLEEAITANLQERERLRAIITHMGDGVVAFDADFQPMFYNEAARRLLQAANVKPEQLADHIGLPRLADDGFTDKTWVESLGDAMLYIHVTAIVRHRRIEGYVAVIRDVTEQEKLNKARRDFVANVSHELRTPLTSIKSYIEALQEGAADDPDTLHRFLSVIAQETNRMVRLTRDLLQLSGLDHQRQPPETEIISVRTWLARIRDRFLLPANQAQVALELHCEVDAVIRGNRDMLDRVLDNILGNALKYTPAGGRVIVSVGRQRRSLLIQVQDNGPGIPEKDLPHVFERFYRVDKARSRRMGGSGLGLALAREIAQLHGGDIAIDSQLGKGTTVYLTLPVTEGVAGP